MQHGYIFCRRLVGCAAVLLIALPSAGLTATTPNADNLIRDYGRLPKIRSVSISPDGAHLAFIERTEEGEAFVVVNRQANKFVGGANASSLKARSVYFATNKHVILVVSKTSSSFTVRGKWEQSASVVYNIETQKIISLPKNDVGLYRAQSGLGRIVGLDADKARVFMPAYVGNSNPVNHLLRVKLGSGLGRVHARGTTSTLDWFVGSNGKVLAREDFQKGRKRHVVYSYLSGKAVEIYSEDTDVPNISLNAVSQDEKKLFFVSNHENDEALYTMSLVDGTISGPEYMQDGRDIDGLISLGLNRKLMGLRISGPIPDYEFFAPDLNDIMVATQEVFPTSSVVPLSSTANVSHTVLSVSGNQGASEYLIYDKGNNSLKAIARSYPSIDREDIGEILAIRYSAIDGTKIPAIITWPVGVEDRKSLPLLVFPHGGPESYDRMEFDWWAQYFARHGYLVLQPNFRGSTGYGPKFRMAGRGEWGRLMQDDITDGVNALIEAEYADPDRVCIMGASYGGYAALAGGAYTPDLYRCVISVAGVSDLPQMLKDEKFYSGNHWVVSYWQKLIGDSKKEREKLKAISPINFAENFAAPVLLIHGKDDTVVHPRQSKRMLRALRKAKKQVEYIELRGEDHWLSGSETRMATLQAISEFLQVHNPSILPAQSTELSGGG